MDRAEQERLNRIAKRHCAIMHEGPRMHLSDGDRRNDCAGYADCLDRFIAQHCQRGDASGHCPATCSGYSPARVEVQLSSNLGVTHGGV
jgi:hypothetical protein